jgi:hypothetical protein
VQMQSEAGGILQPHQLQQPAELGDAVAH